ncbi:M4 family metallopeptidase [Kitasatospora sp. NBC_00240]|uniref:M4 family metallopeptidase n=1 Tax=Kitasatospora sp. NBC_00240 TaxID=2903567 RepID=UPI00225B0B1B|nr:M4 family metallopeptidase [Kitasatospora sp. NBC_00240]MCX5216026.1 M4 family metallopeptidase [Kitasatospora sp. NBC_00240]
MKRTLLVGSLALVVGSLAIVGTGVSASAAPAASAAVQPKPSDAQALQDATDQVTAHPQAVLAGSHDTFRARSVQVDAGGTRHVHFDRSYDGLPVLGGDVLVHSGPGGQLDAVTLSLRAPLSLSVTPSVTGKEAVTSAAPLFRGTKDSTTATLTVDALGAAPKLVWEVVVHGTAADQSPSHLHVLVDARTGAVGQSWDTYSTFLPEGVHTGPAAGGTALTATVAASGAGRGYQVGAVTLSTTGSAAGYTLVDPDRGNGETRDAQNKTVLHDSPPAGWGSAFTDADNTWGDGTLGDRATVAVDAHYGIQATWDFYKNVLGRNGIKNDGVGARSFVHYGTNYGNAGWDDDSFSMVYGDGAVGSKPFTEIDVAGHEMSHGVTAATAGLLYFGDAGGLNEATSDIMGTMVEFNANNPADAPDYLIGEKIDINGNGTPLRWMDDPSKDGRSARCWSPTTKNLDPHNSSGVGNHFFYLLAAGSGQSQWGNSPTCNTSDVAGIGNDKSTKIWYRALSAYMVSNTDYPGARTATVKAAKDLYGAGSTECATVEKAWSAVNVAATSTTCGAGTPTPTPTPTPSGNLLLNPGFESGTTSWSATSGVITNGTGATPHSGSFYAWLDGYGTAHTDTASQAVAVPAAATAARLSFWGKITTEEFGTTAYDTLKVQVVTGTTTTTLATYSNADATTGYVQRTLDLSAFKGKTVTIRFTGTEDAGLRTSFLIDDTAVTTG